MSSQIGNLSEQELIALIKKINFDSEKEYLAEADSNEPSRNDGSVEAREQQIIVQDPKGDGIKPVIRPVWPVRLTVNGHEVNEEIAVSASDHCEWRIEDKPLFDIRVSDDKMAVYLLVHAKEKFAWRLSDGGPSTRLELVAEEDRSTVFETLHYEEIIEKLEQLGIKAKLDVAAIVNEANNPSGKEVLIAEGKQPVPGEDARLELYFPEQITHEFFEVNGTIDFRNHYRIPSVQKGQLIAKKLPMVQGQSGFNVFGESIPPKPPKDLIVVTKSNVQMTDNGEFYALKDGRPRLTGTRIKTLDITTAHIEYGDVDIGTGNIVFSGDVIIYGNVNDNMIVESLGNVYVYGCVYRATITATGSIYVRDNVLGSKLYSGYFGVLFNRLYKTSKRLSEEIGELIAATRVLTEVLEKRGQKAGLGQLALLLIENKFKDIPTKIGDLLSILTLIHHSNENYNKLKEMGSIFLNPYQLVETLSMHVLQGFRSLLRGVCRELEQMQEAKAKTMIGQCQNSKLKSNGDIVIMHDGVILSDLYADADIRFEKTDAACRGSTLEARGSIYAKIVGSQTGTLTLLKAGERILVQKMLSGKVCVGRCSVHIEEAVENMMFTEHWIKEHLKRTRRNSQTPLDRSPCHKL